MKSLSMAVVLVLASMSLLLAPIPAGAFGLSGIGGRIGGVDPEGPGNALLVGGHLEFEQSGTRLHLQPGVMFWSRDNLSDVNPNFDVMYHFSPLNKVSPYVGGGAGFHFYNVDLPGGANDNH